MLATAYNVSNGDPASKYEVSQYDDNGRFFLCSGLF
jgi:hypothetical protein